MTLSTFNRLALLAVVFGVACAARGQSFSLQTDVNGTSGLFSYSFVVAYDQAGLNQQLNTPIWNWSFSLDASSEEPTSILAPDGWLHDYDISTGQFVFYTEGSGGWPSGDFGDRTIAPGETLAGFGLTTRYAPRIGSTSAFDTEFNLDSTTSVVPGAATVPEPASVVALGFAFTGYLRRRNVSAC